MFFRTLAVLILLVLPTAANAQAVRLIGDFRDWSAYSAIEGTGNICFALARPIEVVPVPDGFTEAYLYLTSRPSEGVSYEFNLVAGFNFAPDTRATVTISEATFDLFTQGDAAWLLDAGQGEALATSIRAGTTLIIEGTSDKGIKVRETFSLAGATAASRALDAEC